MPKGYFQVETVKLYTSSHELYYSNSVATSRAMLVLDNLGIFVRSKHSGFVFLAKSTGSANFRIGWTKDLTRRKKELRANNESNLHIIKYFYTPDARADKEKLQQAFSKYHKHNDWYEVSDFNTFQKNELKFFSSHTWKLARKRAIKTLEELGVKNTPGLQEALSLFINPMKKTGTATQMKKLDYSLNKIRELILEKGEPQKVAISFLSFPEIWDALYTSDAWEKVWEIDCLLKDI